MRRYSIETQEENDGRWLAEIPELPGVLVYGSSRGNAIARAEALALRVLADRIEHGETEASPFELAFVEQ